MVKLLVCDMAGTTVRDDDFVANALLAAFAAHGVEVTREQTLPVMGVKKPVAVRMLLDEAGHPELADPVHARFVDEMVRFYREDPSVVPMPGAEDVFRWCRERGIKVGLDTGFDRRTAQTVLDRFGWGPGVIDASVTSDEVAHGRPAPDMVLRLMDLNGVVDPVTVIKVGDSISDMGQGVAAGCLETVGVRSGAATEAELLEAGATVIVDGIADLPSFIESLGR